MSEQPLEVFGFETSNNMKVRVGLGYKSLPYVFHAIDPADRSEIERISGQFLTPVLRDGELVLTDSGTILRQLDVRYRDTPRLFGTSRREQWEIEDWELFARARLAGPMMRVVHGRVNGTGLGEDEVRQAGRDYAAALEELARHLGDRPWIVGETMSAADVHAACVVHRVRLAGIFEESLESLEPWRERVMAFDGVARIG